MKIGILSQDPNLYSTKRIAEAAKKRGHDVRIVKTTKCFMNINSTKNKIYYKDEKLDFDAVIPRIAASITFYGISVVRQFEMSGVYALNGSLAITRARDKLRAHQILSRKKTGHAYDGLCPFHKQYR